jgi:hypothetical protein
MNVALNQWSDNQSTAKNLAKSRIENKIIEKNSQHLGSLC